MSAAARICRPVLTTSGAAQSPVQQLLVATETINVMTSSDNPIYCFSDVCDWGHVPITIAYDPEPYSLAGVPQDLIVQNTIGKLSSFNDKEPQEHLWHELDTNTGNVDLDLVSSSSSLGWFVDPALYQGGTFYVAAMSSNMTTGILREHAMRVNSSVSCEHIARTAYPTNCSGTNPFQDSFFNSNISIRVCAPGNTNVSPWTFSRNRQDIQEEFFLDYMVTNDTVAASFGDYNDLYYPLFNYTIHCTSQSTRGYFELGNYHNEYTPGPLMQTWPDNQTMWDEYNDYLGVSGNYYVPSVK